MPEDKKGKGQEESLDAFFEPTEDEVSKDKEHKYYPVDKDKVSDLKDLPEEQPEAPAGETKPEGEKPAKKLKLKKTKAESKGGSKTLLIILIAILVLLVLAAGGYFGGTFLYKKFIKKTEEITKTITKPKPAKPVTEPAPVQPSPTATPEKPGPTPPTKEPTTKPTPLTPSTPTKPSTPATPTILTPQPVKPSPSKPAPVQPTPTKPTTTQPSAKPTTPAPSPIKPQTVSILASLPSSASSNGWACQVEADMLPESMEGPVNRLKALGYNNIYYVDTTRIMKIYHLYLTGSFDHKTAEQKMNGLVQLGFKPRLEQTGNQFRVIVYSYGSGSIAQSSKAKVEQAGLGPAEIITKTAPVTLHQIRIGPYSTQAYARKVLNQLRANDFKPVLVRER
jgi:hypothetical protein